MNQHPPLAPAALYTRCDDRALGFELSDELEDFTENLGQERATEALRFGIGIPREGFNLFVLGPIGSGKHRLARHLIDQQARSEPIPADCCYVNNFAQPHKPKALRLPPGKALGLKQDMEQLVEDLRAAIASAFETDDYRSRVQEIEEELKERQEHAINGLQEEAKKEKIALMHSPGGFAFAPTQDGEVISRERYDKLPDKEKKRVEKIIEGLQQRLREIFQKIPDWQREARERLKELNKEVTLNAVDRLIGRLLEGYAELPEVVTYLEAVKADVVDNVDQFRRGEDEKPNVLGELQGASPFMHRYRVNVLVDHGEDQGAPIVYEDNPTYQNLLGRVEHEARMGTLITDFTLIKGGALHRANGGYLLLDVHRLLIQPFAWEALKQALRSGEIRMESLAQMLSLISTVSLEPEPFPLDVKVVLLGDRLLYYLLYAYDREFAALFKVSADFEDRIQRSPDNDRLYARMIATLARKDELRPLHRTAVARMIEHAARVAGDAEKLSCHARTVSDLLCEADYRAGERDARRIEAQDVEAAIGAQIRRSDRVRNRIHEEILRNTVLIDTEGTQIARVNGLSVIDLGNFAFGQPSRITATARLGEGDVVDIEREAELGGPIHSKGVMILSAYLASRFCPERPLSLSASLVFEQSYGMVEGDSASVAETCALLSALSEVPVKQSLAVTGSVNQHGQVQAIGGVNEKIEGFFDVCSARGLSGEQGVLIPAANVKHLMLRRDVVEAAEAGNFHVYAIESIDQALTLLTGETAGERDESGLYPPDSVNGKVEAKLLALFELRRQCAELEKKDKS
jgi:lon-related putative ATP-dependent protease